MTAILNVLLEITIYSAVLYGVILLFKKVFNKHISAALNYAVWALLIIRLLMPATIDSGFSLFVIKEPQPEVVQNEYINNTNPMTQAIDNVTAIEQPVSLDISSNAQYENTSTDMMRQDSPKPTNWTIDWQTALVLLWVTGILGSVIYIMASWKRLNLKIKQSRISVPLYVFDLVRKCKSDMGIKNEIEVSMHEWLNSPSLSVTLRPRLLLPASLLEMSRRQLEFGIRHELTHYKRKDHLMTLLLILLRCVYWFNPIVWLSFPQIQSDMETMCDASVTLFMKRTERSSYINTMVELSCRPNVKYVLGMGMCNGRKALEKRVKGVFMKNKTKPSVRLVAVFLVFVMLVVCFTTACQPTPEKEVVVNKNNNNLNEKIDQSASPIVSGKSLQQAMAIPTKWTDAFENQNGKISFIIDATIEIPNVDKVPVVSVTPAAFTQEQVDQMVKVLLNGNDLYEPQELTREQLQSEIVDIQLEITEAKKQPDSNDKNMWLENLQNQLDSVKEQYNKTPEELKKIPATSKIGTIKDSSTSQTGVKVMADTDAGCMLFRVDNGDNGSHVVINQQTSDGQSYKEYKSVHEPVQTPKGVLITREEAENKAKGIAGELDEGLQLAYTGVAETEWQEQVWRMVFIRKVERFPSTYDTHEIAGNESVIMTGPVVPYEKMVISINDKGIAEFGWYTPMKVNEITNENVTLVPYSDIQQIAKDMIEKKYNDIVEQYKAGVVTHTNVTLNKVTLGLMRIDVKDEPGQYKLIPVWDFYGYSENALKNSENIPKEKLRSGNVQNNYSLLTINAIDGSVIDRALGY